MAVSELPGNPNAVWTVKKRSDDEFDAYIIVSFVNATLVLSIGETVEEVTDSGFLGTTPTLSCAQIGDDALVQVGFSIQVYSSTVSSILSHHFFLVRCILMVFVTSDQTSV